MKTTLTHEQFISAVRDIVAANVPDAEMRRKILSVKLTYGAAARTRGTTYFNQWRRFDHNDTVDFATISAMGQQSFIQLAGTTIHELAHVVAGKEAGHDKDWKDTAEKLGLRAVKAAGTHYTWANFAPHIREAIYGLGEPSDGIPRFNDPDESGHTAGTSNAAGNYVQFKAVACSHGWGSRGGKSRGVGSGSRMLKVVCGTCGYTCRVTRAWLNKGAPVCPTDKIAMGEV